jgi:hypothetical protein
MSTAPPDFQRKLESYLQRVQTQNSEAAKLFTFLEFIRDAFKDIDADTLEKTFPELERYLSSKSKTLVVRGRIDAFLGNLIIEFKKKLDKDSLDEAELELSRYVSILWAHEKKKRIAYVTLATDGIRFLACRPRAEVEDELEPDDVFLDEIDKINLQKTGVSTAFLWLDRYMLSQSLKQATTESFSNEFGLGKPAYQDAYSFLNRAWKDSGETVLYDQWAGFLRIVYGSRVDSQDLFIRHTYLATVAKLLAYSVFSGGALPVSDEQITEILEGKVFEKWNIHNFLEEDFFSWIARSPLGVEFARALLERLTSYDLSSIDEDILKSLYQELVDPQARHDLGEYYTPEWLAEYMVKETLGSEPEKTILDPACGSGTFLAASIRRKKSLLKDKKASQQLDNILNSVSGVDVHPLAVILSRANFLTALGTDLLSARRGSVSVPVYMADSIRLPDLDIEVYSHVKSFKIKAETKILRLPLEIAIDPSFTDRVVEVVKEYAKRIANGEKPRSDSLENLLSLPELKKNKEILSGNIVEVLLDTATSLAALIQKKQDTVWAFILKNIYKPLFLKDKKFDIIIGNPPWLSFRYIESTDYQKFLKELILTEYHLLDSDRAELITQMELASLFFVRTADLYLAKDGTISFVMPRSIFVGDQHYNFREGFVKPKIGIRELCDLEDVSPLFNVPSCVVEAAQGKTHYPIQGIEFKGVLDRKNSKLSEALKVLEQTNSKFLLFELGQRSFLETEEFGKLFKAIEKGQRSAYYQNFTQGAAIVPSSVWLVDPVIHPRLGFDSIKPSLRSSQRAIERAKENYADVSLEGEVESKFIFQVATGSELAPFCHTTLPIAVLPIESYSGTYRILESEEARRKGYSGLAKWLNGVEKIWKDKRGEKAEKMDIYSWLNYSSKLTNQSSRLKYKVLYNASGTYLVSCIINNKPFDIKVDSSSIRTSGLVASAKAYWFDTNNLEEAYFVCAMLNSPIVDSLIKPMQSRGQWGERDIHKKVLEIPLPKFDPNNPSHGDLVELAKKAEKKAVKIIPELGEEYTSIGKIRQLVKVEINEEILKIDKIVRRLLAKAGSLPNGLEDFSS